MTNVTQTNSDVENNTSVVLDVLIQYIIPYLLIIFIPMGIIGNFLSLVIFIKRRKADRVSAQYLSVLAFFDFLMISLHGTTMWMLVYLKQLSGGLLVYGSQMPTTPSCKVGNTLWNFGALMSGWVIIFFSFERCLVTWSPLKMGAKLSSGKPRKIALVVLTICCALLSSGHLIWTRLIPTIDGQASPAKCKYDSVNFTGAIWVVWFNVSCFLFANGLPLVLISILNVLILVGIKRNRMTAGKSTSSSKTDNRALANLILISFFFILFITPFQVVYLMQTYYEAQGDFDFVKSPLFVQAWLLSDTVQYFNYSINPFIYTLSLKFYQDEVKNILCFFCIRRNKNKALEASQSS